MRVEAIYSQHRNDFSAVMRCEHCDKKFDNKYGYNDANYHRNVVPLMGCPACGLRRDGQPCGQYDRQTWPEAA